MNIQLPPPLNQLVKDLNLEQLIAAVAGAFLVGGLVGGAIVAATGGSSEHAGSSNRGDSPATSTPAPEVTGPVLEGRAKLSALYQAPGPDSGKDAFDGNGQTHPFKGQVIPGFSGMIEIGDGTFYALPDNGFGSKKNSSDFLLRVYTVKPNWETAETAPDPKNTGGVEVLDYISLKDPNGKIPWDIVNNDTEDRLLTGADFDPESFVKAADGTFWIGEEFGPYILHVDENGTLLEAPYAYPGVKSPSNPTLDDEQPNLRNSKGFEAMAWDGRYLYPIFEGYLDNAKDKRERVISQFDTETGEYTGKTWTYLAEGDDALIGDAFLTKDGRLLVLERDDFRGSDAELKKVFEVADFKDTEAGTTVNKALMADLLDIANPDKIGMVSDARAYGVGDPFAFALLSVETIVQLEDGRYLTALDNNFPGDDGRYRGKPDDTEMIIFSVK